MVGKVIDLRKTRQNSKIAKFGLQDRLFNEIKKPGFSVAQLTTQFKKEGFDISELAIRRFIHKNKHVQNDLIKQTLHEAASFKELAIDYKRTIRDILEEVKDVKETCKLEKEYNAYSNLVGRLYQGLELLAKLSGELSKTTKVDVKILYQEINNRMNDTAKTVSSKIFKDTIDVDSLIKEQDEKITRELQGER